MTNEDKKIFLGNNCLNNCMYYSGTKGAGLEEAVDCKSEGIVKISLWETHQGPNSHKWHCAARQLKKP